MTTAPYAPAPVAPPRPPALTHTATGITAGILLLLTFVIPFGPLDGDRPLWSWQILGQKDLPREVMAMLIGAWVIGLAALVLAAALRRMALSIAYLLLGAGGMVLIFAVAKLPVPLEFHAPTIPWWTPKVWYIIGLISPAAVLIIMGIRVRLRGAILPCLLQILVAGAFAAMWGVATYDGVRAATDMPKDLGGWVWFSVVFGLLTHALFALGGLLGLAHGFVVRGRTGGPSRATQALVYIALMAIAIYHVVGPAIEAKEVRLLLSGLNLMTMLVCLTMIFLEGMISFFSELGGMVCQPAAPAAPAALRPAMAAGAAPAPSNQVVERLKHLDALRAQGAISAEEYSNQRARILGQL